MAQLQVVPGSVAAEPVANGIKVRKVPLWY